MLTQQQQRQASNKAASRALLEGQQRPFSFYAADSLRDRRKLEEAAARGEAGSAAEVGGHVRFRASPVPASTHEVIHLWRLCRNLLGGGRGGGCSEI